MGYITKSKNVRRKILKRALGAILLLLVLTQCTFMLSHPPKREFRGTWIATVVNIDWPKNFMDSPAKQKKDLIHLLDVLDANGINAVLLQVRPECDAFYNSNYEPWSYWLTGRQGKAPQPYYDPLQFAIEEAHKRGMELHAWFNPFRAERAIGSYPLSENHVVNTHPEWILSFTETNSKIRILNPGVPAVRKYITDVIMDVVNNYDVDGVHFDDYFYPYPPNQISKTNKDSITYKTYKHGDASDNTIDDWRRENINILMRMVNDSIQAKKPWVKFGVSPFGIYRPDMPYGVVSMDAYNVIYCDPLAWLKNHSVDYLTPQLYWKIGGNQDFKRLINWWSNQAASQGRHLYPGHIFGRRFSTGELPDQLNLVRGNNRAQGDIYFSAKHFDDNTLNFSSQLKKDYYRFPALVPVMDWKKASVPPAPSQFFFSQIDTHSTATFHWEIPEGSGADSSVRFVLYKFNEMPKTDQPPKESSSIYKIVGGNAYWPRPPASNNQRVFFALTAVNRNAQESPLSTVIEITPPAKPLLATPCNGEQFMPDTFAVRWQLLPNASSYAVQIAQDSTFNSVVFEKDGITNDPLLIAGLEGQSRYFWHIAAENPAGKSVYSEPFSFVTAFPAKTLLASPADGESNIPPDTVLIWYKNEAATRYRVQLAQSGAFEPGYMTLDTVLADTFLAVHHLEEFKRRWYYWRVKAINDYGQSDWSETFMFKTIPATYIDSETLTVGASGLMRIHPDSFNSTTKIEFAIPRAGRDK